MRVKLVLLAAVTAIGAGLPAHRPAAAPVSTTLRFAVIGVPVQVIYPGAAIDTAQYHFVGDDHRQIQMWTAVNWVYRFVDTDHRHIEIATLSG